MRGKVVVTISRGRVVWEGGRLSVLPGTSRYVHLPPGGALFEGLPARDRPAAAASPYGATPVLRGGGGEAGGGSGGGGAPAGAAAREGGVEDEGVEDVEDGRVEL